VMWDKVVHLTEKGISDGAFPGGVLLVAVGGEVLLHRAFGRFTYETDSASVRPDTIYDLASLTKVVATTSMAMALYEDGKLDLDEKVRTYVPEFGGGPRELVTVRHLLAHSSGLPAWADIYRRARGKEEFLRCICEVPLEAPPGERTVYSDLGMILLGAVLERISGEPLDSFCRRRIFEPLGMDDTLFNPPPSLRPRIAPTEVVPERGLVWGEVHDENAWAMGGVAPHAGLFGTAGDLFKFARMMSDGGTYGGTRLFEEGTVRLFTSWVPGSTRALGWDKPSEGCSCGRYFSPSSFGHTGFTGTSVWADPERSLVVVLLTNRVHPSRERKGLLSLRPLIHDAVVEALETSR